MSPAWTVAFALQSVLLVAVAAIVLGLVRRVGDTLDQIQLGLSADELGGPIGGTVPSFELTSSDGASIASETILERPMLLLFARAGCAACGPVVATLREDTDRIGDVRFALVLQAPSEAEELAVPPSLCVLFDTDGSAAAAFGNRATPQAYLVGGRRTVDRRLIRSRDDLVSMVEANGVEEEVAVRARDDSPGVPEHGEMRRERGLVGYGD